MSGLALALILAGAVVIRGALKGLSPVESFTDIFDRSRGGEGTPARPIGTGGVSTLIPGAAGIITGGNSGTQFSPEVERWRGLVAAHFPPEYVNQALSVMHCESRGNPNARNPTSDASGLFQHLPKYWVDRAQKAGVVGPKSIFDPESNVKVAGWLFRQSMTWDHWSCKPSVPVGVSGSSGGGGVTVK